MQVLTYQKEQLGRESPWVLDILRTGGARVVVLDSKAVKEQQGFGLMMRADILVTTGSSFAYTAAALVPPGQQVMHVGIALLRLIRS